MRLVVLVSITIFSIAGNAFSEIPVYNAEPTEEFLQTWLLCGPFPNPPDKDGLRNTRDLPGFYNDYLKEHGGETGLEVQEGQVETYDGGEAKWIHHKTDDYAVDLDAVISRSDNVLAYAYCEIESKESCARTLALGSNDGIRVWLNGLQVWDLPVPRGIKKDNDLVPIVLKKGRNTLLLKVEEGSGSWGFCCRLLDFDPQMYANQAGLLRLVTDAEGVPRFRIGWAGSPWSDAASKQLIQRIDFKVISAQPPQQVIWQGQWSGKNLQAIPVDTKEYGEYILQMHVDLAGDLVHEQTIPFTAGPRVEYTLFDKSKTDYRIVIAKDASDSEQWAAKELQHWLKEISGADFPLADDSEEFSEQSILVGFTKHTQALLNKNGRTIPRPAVLDESFTYKNFGPTIAIWGGSQRGTLYGVMTFLEREFGCRWYTPRVTVIPKKETSHFHCLLHTDAPGIRVRNDFYFEAFEPIWAARNKINGAMSYREQPGGVEGYWAVHTFYPLMPPDEFFADHPEYYSLIDGKRIYDHAQLCLTNPDVLKIITERIRKTIRENPQYLIYSVSQNDWHNPCQCEKCQAIAKREESESGPLIWFVNQVAEAIEDEFPDKYIGTLAYQYTRKPCKTIKPRENVVIRLCSIECCFSHDFHSCPENESFLADIQGWAKIAPHLYIWDYVVNFSYYIMPYPNFYVLQSNLKTFRDHNAIGIMEQAAYQSRGGEFSELRAYLLSKLLWNPECDVQHVINDFMLGYYGRSGQYVRAYFDLLHNQVTPDTHIHLGLKPDDMIFSDKFVREALAIFEQAKIVADNEEIMHRVEMASLPVLYLHCKRTPEQAIRDGSYDLFCTVAEREGITHYQEQGAIPRRQFHSEMEAYRKK